MRARLLPFVWVLALCLSLLEGAAMAAPPSPEFRGLAFGAPVTAMPDMEPVATFGEVAFYHRASERPILGEDCSTDIRYGFSRGKLFFVRMTLSGCTGLGPLIRAYELKYGQPAREGAPGFTRLRWRLPTLTVSLSHFAREGKTEVDYVYLPDLTHDEREVWQSPEDIRGRGPIGFRGIRFGRDIQTLTGLVPASTEGAAVYYRRRGDQMELGETRLSDILYGFWQGRFFAVLMRAEKNADFEALRRAYTVKYGLPRAIPATLEEELVWSWDKSQIALSRDAADGGLAIRYADAGLLAEVVAAETAAGAPPSLSGGLRIFSRGDPPRAFRGVAFGSPETALPGGDYLYGHRGRRYFRRANDRLNLGDIPLASIVYAYDANQLASVTLTVAPSGGDPTQDFERVLAAYTAKYGPPSPRTGDDGSHIYVWSWPGLSIAFIRPRSGPLEMHYVDASLLRRREAALAQRTLGVLEQKLFNAPDAASSRSAGQPQEQE